MRPAGRIDYVRLGSGEPLLLIHPLGASKVVWEPVLELLAADHDVIAIDMPGFGASAPLDGVEPTPRNLARAATDFCRSLGVDGKPHVAGISLGGWVAIECARLQRAATVTALCPAGFWPEPLGDRTNVSRLLAGFLLPFLRPLLRTPRGRRRVLGDVIRRAERVSSAQALELVRSYGRSPGFSRATSLMRNAVIGPLDYLEPPITLAWAEFDTLVGPPQPGVVPGWVRQVELPGASHIPTWDAPELVSAVILETTGTLAGPASRVA